jgi:hypothetical protein
MKNSTIRKRTADFLEIANSWQEYYDIGNQLGELARLIKHMALHMADMQKKIDSQAEELKRRQSEVQE